ncbi:MAG: hypothetical protein A2Z14_03920 [Chloroflexi bacterium RBG_16_48_8]|nr:MAG: hypothetical protein A2Z14_03920 [Chloroflexi bacterium RBG_16_48_8]
MRGEKVSRIARKEIDLVVIAARYQREGGSLLITQGYERRGPVWGDVQLLTRESLIEKIAQGKRVVIGRLAELQGDFEVIGPVHVHKQNGNVTLYSGDTPFDTDKLELPLF